MYVRLRSIPLRCNDVRSRGKLSVLSQCPFFFLLVDAQAAIDMSAHLQLTPRDSDVLMRAEPLLHYDRPTTQEGKDDPHT